jgi:hypothetical protein
MEKIKFEQMELLKVPRDYLKVKKELPEQLPLTDLPLFDTESQTVEQQNLFINPPRGGALQVDLPLPDDQAG